MSKIVMTSTELVAKLKNLVSQKTFYKNKYPYNLGLVAPPMNISQFKDCSGHNRVNYNPYAVKAKSFDCSNLYKALFNGYDINSDTVGYFQQGLSNTGDCSEFALLNQCSDVSSDFSKLKNDEPRLLYMQTPTRHIGCFIGETQIDGYTFNVVECTSSWSGDVLYSYVDELGRRFNGTWVKNGLMTPWIKYEKETKPVVTPVSTPTTSTKKSTEELAKEVINGKWGNGDERKKRLTNAGYNYSEVQQKVNELLKPPAQSNDNAQYHIVKKDESLSVIASKYGTTWQRLMKLNNIKNPNLVFPGERIRVK